MLSDPLLGSPFIVGHVAPNAYLMTYSNAIGFRVPWSPIFQGFRTCSLPRNLSMKVRHFVVLVKLLSPGAC